MSFKIGDTIRHLSDGGWNYEQRDSRVQDPGPGPISVDITPPGDPTVDAEAVLELRIRCVKDNAGAVTLSWKSSDDMRRTAGLWASIQQDVLVNAPALNTWTVALAFAANGVVTVDITSPAGAEPYQVDVVSDWHILP